MGGHDIVRAEGVQPERHVPRAVRYRVGLEPEEVLERFRRAPDVAAFREGRFPDLGDPVPARPFVAEIGESSFRIAVGGGEVDGRGYGSGAGMLPTVELRGTLRVAQGATEVDVQLVRQRSARGAHRWAGFVALLVAGTAWLAMGSGALGQRALVLAVGAAFMSPAVGLDVLRAIRERKERLALLGLAHQLLGPISLDDVEHSPYRNPRRPALALLAPDRTGA